MADADELESSTCSRNSSFSGPLKVILVGASGVGKSTLFLRIKDGEFREDIRGETLDYVDTTIFLNDSKSVEVRLYDTAGMEKYHEKSITRSYYLGSRIVLILYSADDMDSVDNLKLYIEDIFRHATGSIQFLIRNKIDLEDQTVKEEEVEAKLQKSGYSFQPKYKHKISAKTGQGVDALFKEIGVVLNRQLKSWKTDERHTISAYRKEADKEEKKSKSSCC